MNYQKTNETLEAITKYMVDSVSPDYYQGIRSMVQDVKTYIAEEQFVDALKLFSTMENHAEGAQNLQKICLKYDKDGVHHPALKKLNE